MVHAIVEGEPGIFPDPIARIMRGIGGLFRKRDEPQSPPPPSSPPPEADPPGDGTDGTERTDRPTGDAGR